MAALLVDRRAKTRADYLDPSLVARMVGDWAASMVERMVDRSVPLKVESTVLGKAAPMVDQRAQ